MNSDSQSANHKGKLVRIFADSILVLMGWLAACMVCWVLTSLDSTINQAIQLIRDNSSGGFLVLLVSLPIYWKSGFYTYGRSYRSRLKAYVVFRSVTLSFLIFGFIIFLTRDFVYVSRQVLVIAWIFVSIFVVGARIWSSLWVKMSKFEEVNIHRAAISDPQSVLVVGGAGYIGSSLTEKLLGSGLKVIIMDNFSFGRDPISHLENHQNLRILEGDFRNIDTVVRGMQEAEAVIHLGGIVGDPACAVDEELTVEVNLAATRTIADVAKGHGVTRFIYASSCSVYGESSDILNESSTLNPISIYSKSKIASEDILMESVSANFQPTILRFGTIYGFSGRTRFDLVVNLLTAMAVKESKITLFGGDQWRPFVHVQDVAEAVLQVIKAPLQDVGGEVINIGSNDQNLTLRQMAEEIQDLVPDAVIVEMGPDSDQRNYRVDFNKAENVLRFNPKWSIQKGIRQIIDGIKHGEVEDYRDTIHSNYKTITDESASRMTKFNGWERKLMDEVGGRYQQAPQLEIFGEEIPSKGVNEPGSG